MNDVAAPLSSVQATIGDATDRIAELADRATEQGRDEIAHGLWEVERSLRAGLRRIETVQRDL